MIQDGGFLFSLRQGCLIGQWATPPGEWWPIAAPVLSENELYGTALQKNPSLAVLAVGIGADMGGWRAGERSIMRTRRFERFLGLGLEGDGFA
jgi:hypothetical protein